MTKLNILNISLKKIGETLREFKKTAYHHYGKSPISFIKFIYYSGIRINTFFVFQNDLTLELPDVDLDSSYQVVKPTLEELAKIREGKNLTNEFYYDEICNAKTCYVVFKNDEIAYIHWVLFKNDYSRFLILSDDVAELNYNTTLLKFRGDRLAAKMISYICKDLKKSGYKKAIGIIHENNYQSIRSSEQAGFSKIGAIKAIGPFNRKLKI